MKRMVCIVGWFVLLFVGSGIVVSGAIGAIAGSNKRFRAEVIATHPGISEQGIGYEAVSRAKPIYQPALFVICLLLVYGGVKKGFLPGTKKSPADESKKA